MLVSVYVSQEYKAAVNAAIGAAEARRDRLRSQVEERRKKLKDPYHWSHLKWAEEVEERAAAIQEKINHLQEAKL